MKEDRTELLYSKDSCARFREASVVVVGLGGVGLYALENIARAGVRKLTVIDGDAFEESNLNRQLYALSSTLGKKKAFAAAERLADIVPGTEVKAIGEFLTPDDLAEFIPDDADFIVDAIDDIPVKAALISYALGKGIRIISSMGTARRKDPSKLLVTTLGRTDCCPLARKLRKLLREEPLSKNVPVVCSKETPCDVEKGLPLPSAGMVPAASGILMAAFVINTLSEL